MRSSRRGKGTSGVTVTDITDSGIELTLDGRKVTLKYADFPWFESASEDEVLNVRRPFEDHLRWPDLDVDLEVDSIFHPEKYPLVSRVIRRKSGGSTPKRKR